MTTAEEIVDAIRAYFSPDDVIDITKSSPLQAKLRLLSYQISKDKKVDAAELAQEWYAVEREKFYQKPCANLFLQPLPRPCFFVVKLPSSSISNLLLAIFGLNNIDCIYESTSRLCERTAAPGLAEALGRFGQSRQLPLFCRFVCPSASSGLAVPNFPLILFILSDTFCGSPQGFASPTARGVGGRAKAS